MYKIIWNYKRVHYKYEKTARLLHQCTHELTDTYNIQPNIHTQNKHVQNENTHVYNTHNSYALDMKVYSQLQE